MAGRLTWQNVDAPDVGRAADILNAAATQIGNGGTGIASAFRNARQDQMDRRSAAALPILAGIQGSGDVAGALSQIGSVLRPEDMNAETREAYLGLMGKGMGFDTTRINNNATRNADGRAQTDFGRRIAREDQEAALVGDLLAAKEGGYRASLIGTESGGNFGARNNEVGSGGKRGHVGRVQFGQDRFADAVNAGVIPAGMTFDQFGSDTPEGRAAQLAAEDWHFADLENKLAPYVGAVVNGQTLDMGALVAMGHLGGAGGAIRYVESGGQYNPADSFGTSLSDYAAKHGGKGLGRTGVADLVPENNLLGMDFWDPQSDDARAQEQEGYNVGRAREADYEADVQKAVAQAGLDLAREAAKGADLPEDVAGLINQSDASDDVKAAAVLAAQNDPAVQNAFATTYDPLKASAIPGMADASRSLDQLDMVVADTTKNNPTIRIQSTADDYGTDPAVKLAENLGNTTEDGKGWATDAINTVVRQAKEEGITISPGEAAAVLYESAEYAGWVSGVLPGGEKWGNTYVNTDTAMELVKSYLTPEQKRNGSEKLSEINEAKAAAESLRTDLAKVNQAQARALDRGDEEAAAKWEAKAAKLVEAALTVERGYSFGKKDEPAKSDKGEKPNTTSTQPTTQPTTAAPGGPETAIRQAAMKVVDDALQVATEGGIDLAGLSKASPETQVRILTTAVDTLKEQGGSPEQIRALEMLLEQAVRADAEYANRP
jgi:hypothetical protein